MRKILWSQNFVKKLIHFIYWPVGLIWKIFVHRSARCKYVYFFRFLLTLLPVFNILFFCKDFYLPKTGSLHFFKWWNQWIFALLTSSWRISFNDCWCSLIAYSIRWTRMTLSLDWKWGEVYNVKQKHYNRGHKVTFSITFCERNIQSPYFHLTSSSPNYIMYAHVTFFFSSVSNTY